MTYRVKSRLIWMELLLLSLLCISQHLNISALNLLLTLAIGGIIFLAGDSKNTSLALYVALPMFNLFNAKIGSTSMYYLYILIYWFRYLHQRHFNISLGKLLALGFFLALRIVAGNIEMAIKWFLRFSVFILSYQEDDLDGQLVPMTKYMSIAFAVASLCGYIMLQSGTSIYTGGQVWSGNEKTIRFAGLIGDSVFFSQCCAVLIAANLTLSCQEEGYVRFGLPLTVITAGFCLLSYAKTGLVLVAAGLLVYLAWFIIHLSRRKKTILWSGMILCGGIAGIIALVGYLLSDSAGAVVQNYMARFASKDLLTGRGDVWTHYWNLISNSWRSLICGISHQSYNAIFFTSGGNDLNRAHNIYIESLCIFGLPGTLIVFAWIFITIGSSIKRRDGFLYLVPLGVILISGMTLHGHFDFHYYFFVALAVAFATQGRTKRLT